MTEATLSPTGTTTSRLGVGMATLMREPSPKKRRRLLDTAYDAGFRHFDTAPSYGLGTAEATLAPFLAEHRDDVTVATKFGLVASVPHPLVRLLERPLRAVLKALPALRSTAASAANAAGPLHHPTDFSVSNAAESVAQSLRALGTDYLDVLLLHEVRPENLGDAALLDWLDGLRARGTARSLGLATTVDDAATILTAHPGVFDVVQVPFNPSSAALPQVLADFDGTLVVHSVFNPALACARDRARRDPAWSRRFQGITGVDPSAVDSVARLLVAFALEATPRGLVLLGASSPGHLQVAPSYLDHAFSPDVLARLPALLHPGSSDA